MITILKNLKKWILMLISLVLVIVGAWWLFKKMKKKEVEITQTATQVMDKIGVSPVNRTKLNSIAVNVAQNLGFSYSWYDPRRWSENDKEVFELLKDLSQGEFDIVKQLYFEVYAKGRSLSMDLSKFLDSKYYQQLKVK